MIANQPTYQDLCSHSPVAGQIITERAFDYLYGSSNHTSNILNSSWEKNITRNTELYYKHGSVGSRLIGLGLNKAVIGVGAGPGFHINKDVLKNIFRANSQVKIDDQEFIIAVSNHQFKPLLKIGIYPHFVVLLDSGTKVYDQLCLDVPALGKDCILIASLFASHKVLSEWDRQGRSIAFFLPDIASLITLFENETGEPATNLVIPPGGNVLNLIWALSIKVLHSKVFMCVGNDLSFEHSSDIDRRKLSFYADGKIDADTTRNQAADYFAWMGFKFFKNLVLPEPTINLSVMGTSRQMFLYKLWLEMHIPIFAKELKFHYFNCSEQGILGVLAHSWDTQDMYKRENWYLLDELTPRYHTTTLHDAVQTYLEIKSNA